MEETQRENEKERNQPEAVPEWLKGPGEAPAEVPAEAASTEAAAAGPGEGAPEESPTASPSAEPELPVWLKEFASPLHEPGAAAPTEETPAAAASQPEELPGWLREAAPPGARPAAADEPLRPEASASGQEPPAIPTAEQSVSPAAQVPSVSASEQPDWLRELEGLSAPETPESGAIGTAPGELEPGELPEWMRELAPDMAEAAQPPTMEAPHLEEAEREGLPDWLREPVPEEPAGPTLLPGTEGPEQAGGPTHIPATLAPEGAFPAPAGGRPAWIEQFQPPAIPALAAVPTLPEVMESEGPLAGIRGVLPVASVIAEAPAEPVTPAPRLHGSDILKSLLTQPREGPGVAPQSQESVSGAVTTAPRLLTINRLIYLAILLAALIPFFLPADWSGLGLSVTDTPTTAFYDQVHGLAPGSTVLLAFDYDTGQAPELNPAARVVVQDLAQRGVNVIALSTSPVGAQLAETILNEAAAPNWLNGQNFVNVGYIPGEEAGLRALAEGWLPAGRIDFDNQTLATVPLAARVQGLKDIALVVEFAGGEDTLRWWMEQVQPRHQTTFVAAVSAAVDQQARTYVSARQLAASLRGLVGAAEYQLLTNQTGLTVRTVDAQSFIHVVLFVLILLGNLALLFGIAQKRQTAA